MTHVRKTYTITLDDDPMVHKMISRATGLNSLPFTSTAALVGRIEHYDPVALFVDIHLGPKDCGLDAVPQLRKVYAFTPILVVTADEADDAIGQALAAGANDFIRKPINRVELGARLKARLAEMGVMAGRDQIAFGPLVYSKSYRTVSCAEKVCHLSASEALLFECLLQAKGMVVSKDEIKRKVWGDLKVSDNALDKKVFDVRTSIRDLTAEVAITMAYRQGLSVTLVAPSALTKAS